MNVNLARTLDRYLGIPFCFLLSIVNSMQKLIRFKKTEENIIPRKIIFLELSEMGSAILAYSAMKKAKEMYPEAKLYFWIFSKNQSSVHILNIIPKENVVTMRSENIALLLVDTLRNLWQIKKEKIDAVIDMELFSRFSSILSYLSGAKVRVGFYPFCLEGPYRGSLHTHKVSYNPYMHISKNFLSLVYSLKFSYKERPFLKASLENYETSVPKIKSSEEEEEKIWQKLREVNGQISKKNKLIILNPGINENLPLRRWAVDNYKELTRRLLTHPDIFIVLIGTESRSLFGEMIFSETQTRTINIIGKTNTEELLALYNISHLLISHDSGAPNLASLTDINIIVLFGPETPVLYAPLTPHKKIFYANFACSPCISAYNQRRSICKDNRCMRAITVEDVYNAARDYLYTRGNQKRYTQTCV